MIKNIKIMNELILTKESSSEEIKKYFEKILDLSKNTENEFPVNLDEVWMLAYNRKDYATDALVRDFIEDVDYQRTSARTEVGSIKYEYKISVPCLEFFIARKIRPVFEVYRKVFHGVARMSFSNKVPTTFSEALRLAAEQQEQIEAQQKLIEVQTPKAEFYDDVVESKDSLPMDKTAKTLNMGIGRNKLFALLRDEKILMRNNTPYQQYVDSGWFRCVESKFSKPNGDICINVKTVVLQKGLDGIRKLLRKKGYKNNVD